MLSNLCLDGALLPRDKNSFINSPYEDLKPDLALGLPALGNEMMLEVAQLQVDTGFQAFALRHSSPLEAISRTLYF